jgi:serine/threonine protein kinase, bacterial
MPLAEGQVIAGYTIVRSLGTGGMGEVYLAQHPRLPRRDALKVLAVSVCADDEYRERFNREADLAATLWHPHIVEVHDRGDFDGQLWIAMDYVEGTDAGRLLEEQPSGLSPDEVMRIVVAIGAALDHAHQHGLLHRDVKPANILIGEPGVDDERIMLADFGVARRTDEASTLTGINMTVGTIAYAAPEQLTGSELDGRADQYALAATAYHLLTGTPPFQHSNPAVVISQHLTAEPPSIGSRKPELSSLGPVFDKALAKSPADRYATSADFARALADRMSTGEDPVTQAPAGPRHSGKHAAHAARRRNLLIPAMVAVTVVIVAVAIVVVMLDRGRAETGIAASSSAPSAAPPARPTVALLPMVRVGANCAPLGAAGLTEAGKPTYCAHLPTTDATIWSMYPGEISSPTTTPGPNDEVYPPELEGPVLVCMEQTGQSQRDCHDAIVEGNGGTSSTP